MSPSLETGALTTKYPLAGLRTAPLCKGFDEFLRTPSYFVLLGFLTVFSVMRSLELVTYTVFILIGLFVVLLGSDLLPLMPLFILSYITPSPHNNPGLEENTVFQYKCDEYYHPEAEGGIIWNDPQIGIDWGVGEEDIILSERDKNYGGLATLSAKM